VHYGEQTEAPPLPPGGLIAHPVGAGKTVIVAAYLARAAAAAAATAAAETPSSSSSSGATLVVCPGHIAGQWLAVLAEFAPKLRCRRVDRREPPAPGEDEAMTPSTTAVADYSPIDVSEWDVVVAAYEDVPAVRPPGMLSVSSSSVSSSEHHHHPHPLWDDAAAAPPASGQPGPGAGAERLTSGGVHCEQAVRGTSWHRVIFDEPQVGWCRSNPF